MPNLDQYYTTPDIAEHCIAELTKYYTLTDFDVVLEPSAGTGAFFSRLPCNRVGIDLEPKFDEVSKLDFFDYHFELGKRYLVIGNPPFGKNASLAVKFFNRCSDAAEVIAFILPRTFRKQSVTNRLNLRFHKLHDEVLPAHSFLADGKPYDVPCVFQIWCRGETLRERSDILKAHEDFRFVSRDQADVAVQRVGVRAGLIRDQRSQIDTVSAESHFFIKFETGDAETIFRKLDFDSVKHNTAGNPSVSRTELIKLYQSEKYAG